MDKYYLTKERFEELTKELGFLKSERRREVAERLKQAKEFGDLSENSEYAEAREEQSRVEQRISELEEALKKKVIIRKDVSSDTVIVGSTVTTRKNGEVLNYTIVGSNEARPENGKISNESPLGRAFLNKRVGDSVEIAVPGGRKNYQILKIE